jgi:hypothetical protein
MLEPRLKEKCGFLSMGVSRYFGAEPAKNGRGCTVFIKRIDARQWNPLHQCGLTALRGRQSSERSQKLLEHETHSIASGVHVGCCLSQSATTIISA